MNLVLSTALGTLVGAALTTSLGGAALPFGALIGLAIGMAPGDGTQRRVTSA